MAEIQLLSEVDADYTKLHDLLVKKNWLRADAETTKLILTISGKNQRDYESLTIEDIEKFPCTDLCTIDLLWQYYSDTKFGFSIQNRLWKIICQERRAKASFSTFSELGAGYLKWWLPEEGWLTNNQITLDLQEIPDGHFPRWGLLMLPLTLEVVWKPGLEGLKALNSRVRIYTEGLLSVNAALCTQYKDCEILVLKSFFSRLGMCEIEHKTLKTIVDLEYNQNNQDSINYTVALENEELESIGEHLDTEGDFTPKSREEARERVSRSIAQRRGQPKFRKDLLEAYGYCCAITGCDAEEALEAAHIIPYCETEDNTIYNGLLLRADIHTLFDLNLIAIAPGNHYPDDRENLIVYVAPTLRHTSYGKLHNNQMKHLPKNQSDLPDKDALISRCKQCGWFI
ncbi:GUN4 domain-containing protein [Microcoleus sp. N9_A1]|uniref:GUN4 domain-containing protein n=1 Tax=Microcoleus sp. N9_A1 TaxID=3055380 RepID=UPI002FD6FB9D